MNDCPYCGVNRCRWYLLTLSLDGWAYSVSVSPDGQHAIVGRKNGPLKSVSLVRPSDQTINGWSTVDDQSNNEAQSCADDDHGRHQSSQTDLAFGKIGEQQAMQRREGIQKSDTRDEVNS